MKCKCCLTKQIQKINKERSAKANLVSHQTVSMATQLSSIPILKVAISALLSPSLTKVQLDHRVSIGVLDLSSSGA